MILRSHASRLERMLVVAADVTGVTRTEMRSARRSASLVRARQICMYIAKRHLDYSLPEIGEFLGGRDHTTVLHGVRRVEEKLGRDRHLYLDIRAILHGMVDLPVPKTA